MEPSSPLARLLSPLPVASYIAWAAVWYSNTAMLGNEPLPGPWADLFMLGFLACWLWLIASDDDRSGLGLWIMLAGLTGTALGLIALGLSGSSPILLILVATQLASRLSLRAALVALFALNIGYFCMLIWIWQATLSSALVSLAAYGSFQMFGLLLLRYARTAERMAEELRLVNADLMATRTLLADSARDQERLRLSRELHDVAGHKLTALKMNLRSLRRSSERTDSDALATADALAGELLDDLRAVVRQLRRNDGLSLKQGIEQLAAPLRGLDLHLDIDDGVRIGRVIEAETLMRVAQEGLTNAVRHGRASDAWLRVDRANGSWKLALDDNGQVRWPIQPGLGIRGMQERLNSLDGTLEYGPSERGGLSLTARLPVEARA